MADSHRTSPGIESEERGPSSAAAEPADGSQSRAIGASEFARLGPWALVALAVALVAVVHELAGPGAAAIAAGAVAATGLAVVVGPDLEGPRGRAWVVAAVGGGMALALTLNVVRDPADDGSSEAAPEDAVVRETDERVPSATRGVASLDYADLSGAELRGANLSGMSIRFADLSGADLSGADLSDACLLGADLSGARVAQATFRGSDLTGATFDESQVDDAIGFPDDAAMELSIACD